MPRSEAPRRFSRQARAGPLGAPRGAGHDEHGHEAWALQILGEIRARSGPHAHAAAADAYRAARALAERLGMRPLVARAQLGLAGVSCAKAKHNQYRALLATALTTFGELNMPLWLARTESAATRCPGPA